VQRGRVRRRGNRYERETTFDLGRSRNAHNLVVVLDRDFLADGGIMTKDEALELALEALEYEADKGNDNAYQRERDAIKQVLAAPVQEPVFKPCSCRWKGEEQVQQCTLHAAHIEAIHEWAERAKTAEAKLKEKTNEQ
jgi:hypothetical protein